MSDAAIPEGTPTDRPPCNCEVFTQDSSTCPRHQGDLPVKAACAGCLPAEGDYGDGEPPMVMGRHVEGCPAAETAPTGGKEL